MSSGDRLPVRRQSKLLGMESLEDRHLLSSSPLYLEPQAIDKAIAEVSVGLFLQGVDTTIVRPSASTVLASLNHSPSVDLSPFIVDGGVPSSGIALQYHSLAYSTANTLASEAGAAASNLSPTPGDHGAFGWLISSNTLNPLGPAHPDLTGVDGNPQGHLTETGPYGQWPGIDPQAIDQFLRAFQPPKPVVLYLGEFAETDDPQAAPSPAASPHGGAEARIVRALRDSESEVSSVVLNSDGAYVDRALKALVRSRTSSPTNEPLVPIIEPSASPPNDSRPGSDEDLAWSRQSRLGEIENSAVEVTATPRETELLTSFNPFDRESIDRAIDELLGGLGNLEEALPSLEQAGDLIPHALWTAAALTLAELVRRKLRGDAVESEEVIDTSSPGLPGFPNRWAADES